jgi:biopolymer transport protein ExbD
MLDVVFIMLIFFIVTASFVKESAIDTRLPPTATDHRGDVPSIVIDVRANGDIWMGQRRVDASAVRANSERLHAENPKAAVLVRAHVKFSAQTYVALADAARQANVYQVALAPYEDSM